MNPTSNKPVVSAFSLFELLTVIATLAVVASIAIPLLSNPNQTIKKTKLERDVIQLNSALKVFVSNGGSLSGLTTAQQAIDALKRVADSEGQKLVVGLRGSMVDKRLFAVDETGGEMRPRAQWKPGLGKFVIANSTDGVLEFRFDESLASVDYGSAPRKTKLAYNGDDGWVWTSTDYAHAGATGPSTLPTLEVATLGAEPGANAAIPTRLAEPTISPGSGIFPLGDFPLVVTITNNPANPDSSMIYYSTSPNAWAAYTGPFAIEPGTSVTAFASSNDENWVPSDYTSASFGNHSVELEIVLTVPKNPISYAEAGGALEPGDYDPITAVAPITVSLVNGNEIPDAYQHSGNFRFGWNYDGSDPLSSAANLGRYFENGYPGDEIEYSLDRWEGASMLPIRVAAKSNNPSVVTNSPIASVDIEIARTELQPAIISYDPDSSGYGLVELSKIVDTGDMPVGARIYYTIDGTDPGDDGNGNPIIGRLYTGPFDPALDQEFAGESLVVARVYPPEDYAAWFDVSVPSTVAYVGPDWEISGNTDGWFSSPEGPSGLVSNIEGSETNSYFQWGDPGNWGTGANWLNFYGASFTDVSVNERFLVGQLDYYNGTISLSSLATAIDFSVELAFEGTARHFDYSFDLLTTPNDGTDWENADYVWFNDTASSQPVNLYGHDYTLLLEFAETTEYGYSSVDQFHVQEAQSASASIYATLVSHQLQ